jgi:hypothetical protein
MSKIPNGLFNNEEQKQEFIDKLYNIDRMMVFGEDYVNKHPLVKGELPDMIMSSESLTIEEIINDGRFDWLTIRQIKLLNSFGDEQGN